MTPLPATPRAPDNRGVEMFARYAYAPNHLGYCGPPELAGLRSASADDVRAAARSFWGAWPYLEVLSNMTGIADPLDHRLVESYWLGGGVAAELDSREFASRLLAVIGPLAGQYWSHLTNGLAGEAAANHCFHVFGVYPWSRLLGRGMDEHPLHVLDNCRITWATVVSCTGGDVDVNARQLQWDGHELRLSEPSPRHLEVWEDGYCAVPDMAVGDQVALHWGRVCGRLTPDQCRALQDSTARQLSVTNRRLAGSREDCS
ncbi:DUF6390 family protein [Mycobacterium sp. OTB74]|uniref:DUF6390 family protein n=1 Tax=Mycobacterium sp. OTB74 TaxID=1853452 RepID=UPI00247712BB|nr:DUF6390 family protein [Mycobacterium sp. OTB74]MDH6247798.1 hypothetical protein [Mycobacterium sp. OTB74]